jgi:hypothetical protein
MAQPLEQPQSLLDFRFFKPVSFHFSYFPAHLNLQLLELWVQVDLQLVQLLLDLFSVFEMVSMD